MASGQFQYLEISHNVLNLPCTVRETWGRQRRSLTYTYLADGTKVSARILGGEGLRYSGSFVYAVSADGSETLESVGWDEGRMIVGSDGTVGQDQWFVRDHLGNVRSVIDLSAPEGSTAETALVEQSDYLPFGTRIAVTGGSGASDNRYRYAGKEEQRFGTGPSPMDLEHLDFGARFYDPFTARWTTPDPLASEYPSISPYAYCANDPVNFVDPDGRVPRVYIQRNGLGHVFVTTHNGNNTVVYSYGRYGAISETSGSTSGRFTPNGEGVLLRYEGQDAANFLSRVNNEGNFDIYTVNNASDEQTSKYYDDAFNNGTRPSDERKDSYNDQNARVIDQCSLFESVVEN